MVFVKDKFQIAHVRNLDGVFKGFVAVGEQFTKFLLALEVEFFRLEFHTVGFVHSLAGLDTQQNILHLSIFTAQIVGIVGDDQGQTGLTGDALYALVDRPLLLNSVILQFQIEAVRAENFCHLQGMSLGGLVILFHQILGDRTGQTGGSRNQSLMILLQQFHIHTGFAVETTGKCLRNQHTEILIALAVFAQQHQMVRIIVNTMDTVFHLAAGQIYLTADDGLDARSLGSFIKINAAIHDTVICDRDGSLPQLLDPVHHAADAACAVKEGVFCMDMQMYKTH